MCVLGFPPLPFRLHGGVGSNCDEDGQSAPERRTIQNCSIYFQGVCPNNSAHPWRSGAHAAGPQAAPPRRLSRRPPRRAGAVRAAEHVPPAAGPLPLPGAAPTSRLFTRRSKVPGNPLWDHRLEREGTGNPPKAQTTVKLETCTPVHTGPQNHQETLRLPWAGTVLRVGAVVPFE